MSAAGHAGSPSEQRHHPTDRPATNLKQGDDMDINESHVRAQHVARVQEAARLRRGHYLALARRRTRRAERAALQARLVLARAL